MLFPPISACPWALVIGMLLGSILGTQAVEDVRAVEDASRIPLQTAARADLPTLFLVGDSTVKVGTAKQRGWGEEIGVYFDPSKINVVNRAIGGRSSRTFQSEGRWAQVVGELKAHDFVLMQFGHNDGGDLFKGTRPRASLKGNGEEVQEGVLEAGGQSETVHSFGWYMRKYVTDSQAKSATPIVCSLIPRKIWTPEGRVVRATESYGKWAREAAAGTAALFIDLNEIVSLKYEALGQEKVNELFADEHTHTTPAGAQLNAACVIAGLKGLPQNPLAPFFSEKAATIEPAR